MTTSKNILGLGGICFVVLCLGTLQIASGQQKFCGPKLAQVMELICPNGYHGYRMDKRSSVMPEDDYNSSNDEGDNFALDLDIMKFISSNDANSMAKTRRRRHAITHECCDKGCYLSEIKSYCRPAK